MEPVIPDFATLKETIDKNPKWQEKVEALQRIEAAIKSHPDTFSTIQEAVIQYSMLVSRDYKVANINLLKASYSIAHTVIESCGAGPRACRPVIEFCVSKIHDKKIGSDMSSLLSCIAECIGPSAVFDIVCLYILLINRFVLLWKRVRLLCSRMLFCSISTPC